jgi:DNA-binding beta-propeller fold protein YncE/predicted Ser/Thr protein kinase
MCSPTGNGQNDATRKLPDETIGVPEGRMIGNYQLLRELGRGGMGVVYKAYEESLNRMVALKVLPPALTADPMVVKRFEREARALAALNHPNIVAVYAVGEAEGEHFIAMEYVSGCSLNKLIAKEGYLQPERAVRLVLQVAEALSYAHKRGIVHRDLKPSNIMVEDNLDRVKVADFGLARILGDIASLVTAEGTTLGTPDYMSPEQVLNRAVDQRTDVYSLGVVLFELLCGRRPYQADSPLATMRLIADAEPRRFPTDVRPVPKGLVRITEKAIAKDRSQRFSDMEELIEALAALAVRTRPRLVPIRRNAVKRIALLSFLMALLLVLLWQAWRFGGKRGGEGQKAGESALREGLPEAPGSAKAQAALSVKRTYGWAVGKRGNIPGVPLGPRAESTMFQIALSPDESTLYAAYWTSDSPAVVAYSTLDWSHQVVFTYGRCHGGVVLSPDGRYVYATTYYQGGIARYDTQTGEVVHLGLGSWAVILSRTPDGNSLLATYDEWTDAPACAASLALVNVAGGAFEVVSTLPLGGPSQLYGRGPVTYSADGRRVYLVTGRSTTSNARVLEISFDGALALQRSLVLPFSDPPTNVVRVGDRLCVGSTVQLALIEIDLATFLPTGREFALDQAPFTLGVHPDDRHIFVLHDAGALSVIDAETGDRTCYVTDLPPRPVDIEFTADGRRAFVLQMDPSGETGGIVDLEIVTEVEAEVDLKPETLTPPSRKR